MNALPLHSLFSLSFIFRRFFYLESATVQDSTTMMTGRVVGILQRNSRDFVVTIPDREESVKKTTEKVSVYNVST